MTTAPPFVPPPPRGPGVQPPFPAPPVEGKGRRIGMGLGIAGTVMVLVCGGGVAALIGLVSAGSSALQEQAHAAVDDYLNALKAGNYAAAYDDLCESARRRESQADFRARVSAEEPIVSWRLGEADLTYDISVPVEATYAGGDVEQLTAELDQSTSTGEFELCELAE
ncbi:Rv0361 family membrane protein [Paractinoplanes atraurantiacus]|uniref:DUF4878 domain-containing protein n=1 Tax=Paractinoplanes atraurantiacus TaxID=1036182 RepID=A0A285HH16_9ACTN|nr:hypothetical protein [Actinoplanes atraurantiacus]SNY34863.1 hypothetical protein SAMN05421748_104348 [Actinoplanes atraurantiacus]